METNETWPGIYKEGYIHNFHRYIIIVEQLLGSKKIEINPKEHNGKNHSQGYK